MSTVALVCLLVGALAGGFVSGLAGFGTALLALGIRLYVVPPAVAVPLVLICSVWSGAVLAACAGGRRSRQCMAAMRRARTLYARNQTR